MNIFLTVAFLFLLGSMTGWVIEVIFRRFFSSANPERKWINPGFLEGPYLPLYGFSTVTLYLSARFLSPLFGDEWWQRIILFAIMAAVITFIEYIAGIIFIKGMKIKLWDYSKEKGNIQGIICPKFSFFWAVLSAIYFFLIHPAISSGVEWLASHLSFSFVIGFIYGIMVIDFAHSMNIVAKIRKFAKDKDIVVKYEELKSTIRKKNEELAEKTHFMLFLKSTRAISDDLKAYFEKIKKKQI